MRFTGACLVCALALLPARLEAALADVNPVSFDFGQIKVGDEVEVVVNVKNTSAFTLTLAGGGTGLAEFPATSNCGGSISSGATCQTFYRFVPTARGPFSANTSITLSGSGQSEIFAFQMQGIGTESLAQVYPVSIDFGLIGQGITVSVPVKLANTHSNTLAGFAGGGVAVPFGGFQDCASGLAPGATCEFTYTFTPTSSGLRQDSTAFSFSSDGISQSVPISLTGTGKFAISRVPIARVWPITIGFGTHKRGLRTSVAVTIRNLSLGSLQNFTGGGLGAPFSGAQNCAGGVPIGGSCTFTYRFTPDELNEVTGTTSFSFASTAGGNETIEINLSGTGTGTLARVSPITIDYGKVRTGVSVTVPVTIFNDSDSTLTSFAGGGIGAPFGATQNCSGGVVVASMCTFNYTFTPTAHGPAAGSTNFSFSNDSGLIEGVPISLSGFGDDVLFADGFE